ncbi:MAG: hypothetical protein R3Y29_00910 [bacterium]
MKKMKKVLREEFVTQDVICNMCGLEIKKNEFNKLYDYVSVSKQWGYLSSLDGQSHEFDLCDSCYTKIINNFKIKIN